jgi:hypothetical protein
MWSRAALAAVSIIAWCEAAAQERASDIRQRVPIAAMATVNAIAAKITTNSIVDGRFIPAAVPSDSAEIDTIVYGTPRLYELRLVHVASATLKVYDSGHDVLVPLDQFCHMAELLYSVDIHVASSSLASGRFT